jgi:hypothetical protein
VYSREKYCSYSISQLSALGGIRGLPYFRSRLASFGFLTAGDSLDVSPKEVLSSLLLAHGWRYFSPRLPQARGPWRAFVSRQRITSGKNTFNLVQIPLVILPREGQRIRGLDTGQD